MKKEITNLKDAVYIAKKAPSPEGETEEALQALYDYAKEFNFNPTICIQLGFNYGYALGKHDTRKDGE